jgi:hypothetical protein
MNSEEKAYIAGIIDGEGSIMLLTFHNNQFPSPCVSISSTTLELLEWIKNKVQAGTIKGKKNYNTDRHKNSYTYTLRYNDAINLLIDIEPYLVIESKKKRTQLLISQYKNITPRNGRYSEEMLMRKEKFYEEFIKIK